MDATDAKILKALSTNARAKASAISGDINLSVSAVLERIRKLEDNGIISQYTTILDRKKLGFDITAWIEIKLSGTKHTDSFADTVCALRNVVNLYYLTGEYDYLLEIVAASQDELEDVHRQITSLDGVGNTETHIVLRRLKANSMPLSAYEV
ncbi:MAG: Lrp/AsnC family transcriptional regulator [Oscillospiraceae bacterium]|jgi:Lrp/AsnC family leucine-responsive transcriptional regulator|nr:Lrp/AsnC family transcriptional regulator [Oscillospiraceae bacterium]